MRKSRELKVVSYVSVDGAPPVRWDSLTDKERDGLSERIMNNIGKTLSNQISEHPEEVLKK